MKRVEWAKLHHDGKHQYVTTDEGLIECDGLEVKDYVMFRYPTAKGEMVFLCERVNVTTELYVKGL